MRCILSDEKKRMTAAIMGIVVVGVIAISIVDGILQPPYAVKSAIKVALFLILPIIFSCFHPDLQLKSLFRLGINGKALKEALAWGFAVFAVIMGAYLLLGRYFDLSEITVNMTEKMGIDKENFLWIAFYISFANSLLEEFFFRGFAFLKLKAYISRKAAYLFSSVTFALYHVAMMSVAFRLDLLFLAMAALIIGGLIFNYFNEKYENLYISWLIHMGANFAINGVGCILFGIL